MGITDAAWILVQKLLVAFKACKKKVCATQKAGFTVNPEVVRMFFYTIFFYSTDYKLRKCILSIYLMF